MIRARRLDRVWGAIGVGGVLCASLAAPWAATGDRARSGWSLAGSARRLAIVDGWLVQALLIGFFAVPTLVALAWVLASAGRKTAALAPLALAAVVSIVCASAIALSTLDLRWGLWLNLVVGVVEIGVIVWSLSAAGAPRERAIRQ